MTGQKASESYHWLNSLLETEGKEDALTSSPNANAHCRATGKQYTKQVPGKE